MVNNEDVATTHVTEDAATTKVAYVIYILYLASLLMPVLPILAVIFAYIFENDAKSFLKSHYQYLIRTFWIGMLYFIVSGALIIAIVGILLTPLVVIWWFVRIVKGLKSLMREEPIVNPKTWLF